jgi:hypothetical protein
MFRTHWQGRDLVHAAEITKYFVTISNQLRKYYLWPLKNRSKGTNMLAGIQLAIPALGVVALFQDVYHLITTNNAHLLTKKDCP